MPEIFNLTQGEWEALHQMRDVLTASQCAEALGVGFESPYTLWARKTGRLPQKETSLRMRVGKALEPFMDEVYRERTGRTLQDYGDFAVVRHPDLPWLYCTPDRTTHTVERPGPGPVEFKTTGLFYAADWAKGAPPLDNQLQLQIQIACLKSAWGSIAAYVTTNGQFYAVDTEADPELFSLVAPELERFLWHVKNDVAPPVDASESTTGTLKKLHPKDNGEEIALDELSVCTLKRYEAIKAQIADLEKEESLCKNMLIAAIGDASFAQGNGAGYSYKWQSRKGHCEVPLDHADKLQELGIPVKVKANSEFRVLRPSKTGNKEGSGIYG